MSVELLRRKSFNVLDDAANFGPYDDLPVIPARIDPQLFVSRSDRTQPFFYAGSFDMMLTGMRGQGWVEFRNSPVLHHAIEVGDFITVPARTPHRIVPTGELVTIRYKSSTPGREAVIWFCEQCDTELWRHEYDANEEVPQREWLSACEQFNSVSLLRACPDCGATAAPVNLMGLRWSEIANALDAERDEQLKKETG